MLKIQKLKQEFEKNKKLLFKDEHSWKNYEQKIKE
jgi:hypothetical protein